jgi:hypothetical protein
MPRFDFSCVCGVTVERYVSLESDVQVLCEACGRVMTRQFPLNQHIHIPHHHKAGNEQKPLYTPEEYRSLRDKGYEHADKVLGV